MTLTKQYFPNDEESQHQTNAEWEKLKHDLLLWKGQIPEELVNVTPTVVSKEAPFNAD